jgi:hypothetical protein
VPRFLGIELVEAIVLKDSIMSLNRYEQILMNYLECHSEEKRFWEARVTEISRRGGRRESRALELNGILWEYFEERARFESRFREVLIHEGDRKISMLNLSEYLLRMWAPPPQKKRGLF